MCVCTCVCGLCVRACVYYEDRVCVCGGLGTVGVWMGYVHLCI